MPGVITGGRVPDVELAYLSGDEIVSVSTSDLFANVKSVVIGIPGAYTPVCANQHIPDLLHSIDKLKTAGFDLLVCIAPNDPFVLDAWSKAVDPQAKIRFLSDGNLDFCNALGLSAVHRKLHLGRRPERYMLTIHDGVIQRLKVERSIFSCTVSRASTALDPNVAHI
jgi:2-Cys peroxiredoxin 5